MGRAFCIASVIATGLTVPGQAGAKTVGLIGDFQSELGCAGDFAADCAATQLAPPAFDGVWRQTFALPAGAWSYKVAVDGFTATYPAGANIPLSLGAAQPVRFYYDEVSDYVTDSFNRLIPTLAGSLQSELGCAGDFDPACLKSWLRDPDGDGT